MKRSLLDSWGIQNAMDSRVNYPGYGNYIWFPVWDKGWRVTAEVWTTTCGERKARRTKEATTLVLDTPYDK